MIFRRAFSARLGSLTSSVRAIRTSAAGSRRRSPEIGGARCSLCAATICEKPNVLVAWRGLVPLASSAQSHEEGVAMNSSSLQPTTTVHPVAAFPMPAIVAAAGTKAALRFLEFFAANIRNPHTRGAYGRAVAEFLAWCNDQGVTSVAAVQPLHVAAWIELQQQDHAAPTVKARLAAIRHLFDWLVTGQVIPTNPAGSVRGPSHVVRSAKRRCWCRRKRAIFSTVSR
jgi:hypothetical protein